MGARILLPEVPVALMSHEQLTARLAELALPVAADTLHGVVTGLACAGLTPDGPDWDSQLAACLEDLDLSPHAAMMAALHALVVRELGDGNFGFQLLLPDGDEFLSVRTRALAHWCDGFVCAFIATTRERTAAVEDVLDDLASISRVDEESEEAVSELNNPEEADANERDFSEVYEYVRLAVIDLYVDMSLQANAPDDRGALH